MRTVRIALIFALSLMLIVSSMPGFAQAQENVEKHVVYLTCITPEQSAYKAMEAIVAKYQKEVNPNFTMELQYIADKPAYLQKVKTLAASNALPDMFNIDTDPYANILLKSGALKDLTSVVKDNGLDKVFLPAPLAWGCTSDGVQLAIPIDYSIEVFWYNKDMFKKAGVQVPTTFEDLLKVCAQLKQTGFTPISVSGKEQWTLLRYLDMVTYRYGDNQFLFDLARGKQTMSSDIGRKAAQFVADLGQYFQKGFASTDYTGARDYFTGGNSAMYYMGTWDLASFMDESLSDNMKGNIDYFLLPTVNTGDTQVGPVNFAACSTMPIGFSAAKFDDEMERFICFYANNISQMTTNAFSCAIGGKCPYDSDLARKVASDMDKSLGAIKLYDVELDPATNELIGNLVVSLALGDVTVDDFVKQVDDSIAENAADYFN